MVTVVIEKTYLKYSDPELGEKCQLRDDQEQYAYCQFPPAGGVYCNVVSWKCMDIRNLNIAVGVEDIFRSFYRQAMSELRVVQETQKECLQDVNAQVNQLEQFYFAPAPMTRNLISYSGADEKPVENSSGKQLNIISDGLYLIRSVAFNFHVFFTFGDLDEVCAEEEIISLLPPPTFVIGVVVEVEALSEF